MIQTTLFTISRRLHVRRVEDVAGRICALVGAVLLSGPTSAAAESLADALSLAYRTNPNLQMQRAQLRALDETYVQARTGFDPTVDIGVSATYQQTKLGKAEQAGQRLSTPFPPDDIEQNTASAQITVNQPLYTSGRVSAELTSAEAAIRAGREALRSAESTMLLDVIQAYTAVRRDQAELEVRAKNLDMLERQLRETGARLKAGEVTRTDVAQAEAQLASEHALYAQAEGQLQLSRAAYTAVVGQNPGSLDAEPALPLLPATVDQAFDLAGASNPDLRQALRTEEQSRSKISEARAAYGATVSLRGQFGYSGPALPYDRRNLERAFVGEAVVSQPVFTGGLVQSQVRQALELNTSDRVHIEAVRRDVIQNVANAWNQMITSQRSATAEEAQVKAATVAFDGMRVEYRAGERSTLDVLVAEETLRDAELSFISARRDTYVAEATVLRYVGRLEARSLLPGIPTYAPSEHFRSVERAGAPPWEGLVHALDAVGRPAPSQRAISSPDRAVEATALAAPDMGAPIGTQLSVEQPTTPLPGTAPQ